MRHALAVGALEVVFNLGKRFGDAEFFGLALNFQFDGPSTFEAGEGTGITAVETGHFRKNLIGLGLCGATRFKGFHQALDRILEVSVKIFADRITDRT